MSLATSDLGVLGNLGIALGVFKPNGDPNPDWFASPDASLRDILAVEAQREALVAFVDEALGGDERTTDASGVVWLPIVSLGDPDLTVAVTVDDRPAEGIHVGLGLLVRTSDPGSETTLAIPLFRTRRDGGPAVPDPLLLGATGGRIRLATSITVDDAPPTPGTARLGAIGLDVDLPTSPSDPSDPVFGLTLSGFQLPGATSPRDIRVAADGGDALDDALLDLVLSLVRAQADAAAAGSPIGAVAGLLGLRSGDDVPDFPVALLPAQGPRALADWVYGIVTTPASRASWIGHLASLVGGAAAGDTVTFTLGDAARLALGLKVDTGPTGNARLTPTLGVALGAGNARVEGRADLFAVDLVTGAATALPQLGLWTAAGDDASPVLHLTTPAAHVDTLRVGFALDAQRRLTFVLAADGVELGDHEYETLDLTSPDAVMDAVGSTVHDVAGTILAGAGDALGVVRLLLGVDAPAGVPAVSLAALLGDPVAAVSGYWQALLAAAPSAMTSVLAALRDALADASVATAAIRGAGTMLDPWRVPLAGPLALELWSADGVLRVGVAATTSVDTLGERCTVVETRLAATIAEVDLGARSGSLLPSVEGSLLARERGVSPPRITLPLADGVLLRAGAVGLRLRWSPDAGLVADVHAPELRLDAGEVVLPVALPTIAADGSVTLPDAGWDAVEALVAHLGTLVGGFLGDVVAALGWSPQRLEAGGDAETTARLRLAELVADPRAALEAWVPRVAMSDGGERALALLADLFGGAGAARGVVAGTGHPDDPYRFAIADDLPNVAVWFPPAGLEPRVVAAPEAVQRWRPGQPGLAPEALAAALDAEAEVAPDVRALVEGRDVAGGLAAIARRWIGGDGRIVPPEPAPAGVAVERFGVGYAQLLAQLDLEDLLGRVPTTTVYVALGAAAWPDAPASRVVDLTAPRLAATMFTAPAPAVGDWFVSLAGRADALAPGSATDGTPDQAARLARLLDALALVATDVVVVALGGAGHAARLAAEGQAAVTDLVTLGTPLGPIALTALTTQPAADALRLLHRLLPVLPGAGAADEDAIEDDDLALGRALVGAMMELAGRADPGADLRAPAAPPPAPRAGLQAIAVFGVASEAQVSRAITAIVAAGLAERARRRATTPLPRATGARAGLRLVVEPTTSGTLEVSGDALLTLLSYDEGAALDASRRLRVRLRVSDRAGWLAATPELELRMVTADVEIPLDGTSSGMATVVLHDARVFGQSWERLALGDAGDVVPVLPEARVLLAAAVQRIRADADDDAARASIALGELLAALGLVDGAGALAGDAVDQLVHDAGGLVRQRLATEGAALQGAVASLLGAAGASVDLAARSVRLQGGDATSGRFGWTADVVAGLAGVGGTVTIGAALPTAATGSVQAIIALDPFAVALRWHRPGGAIEAIPLWPAPDARPIARAIAAAAPSLAAHVALELLRRADASARPTIDAVLDALGVLAGAAGDAERRLRPLAGLLADPAGWLRSADSLAASPARIQGLLDALRPLLGVVGAPGSPIPLATGVALAVAAEGGGARLSLVVDPTAWTAPGGGGRLAAGLGAALTIRPSGPPLLGVEAHVGLGGAGPGRRAVHLRLGAGGIELFLRPTAGADLSLVPFAGLGSLAAAAELALPFLLDELAKTAAPVGPLVATVGDALALRGGAPKRFDAAALRAWAVDPVAALAAAVPSITATGVNAIAPLLDDLVPAPVSVAAAGGALTVTIGDVSLAWTPTSGVVRVVGDGVAVPGIERLSFTLALSAAGLDEASVTAGPAAIDAGGVVLRPFVTIAGGRSPAGGGRVAVGMALDDTHRFAGRWLLDGGGFALVASDGTVAAAVETTDPGQVALRVVEAVADLVAAVAIAQDAVQELLDTTVGATNVRGLLRGVVLEDDATPTSLVAGVFDPDTLLARAQRLFSNIAGANFTVTVAPLTLGFTSVGGVVGLSIGLADRMEIVSGDVTLWLENDGRWIEGNSPPKSGVFVGLLRTTGTLAFQPTLTVYGVGLRIGRRSAPLLDVGLTLDSIALHAFAEITPAGARSGGVQLQLGNLAVSPADAGGENGIARGIMRDSGPTPPKPAFSPAIAVQKHGPAPVSVSLRAGDGTGPWWIAIQRGFGPLYLEQVGFDALTPQGRVERVSVLMDGSVSMFGLTCAVDDLQVTYIASNGDPFSPASWAIDLAGLAVSADMGGVSIAGGLLKQTTEQGIEYLGMLLGRFGVYGITIYGGYGEGVVGTEKFTAFFAVGAVNGPLGGPPAFFLTGIGGGFGINRRLVVPTDLSRFGDYPLIQALDIGASPGDPMAQLRTLGQVFPMERGTFWFAAGLSFTSFALVDGIAVVAVQIGDGLDINLLGLARMALPRPQAALVSIEIALLVRFSSSEGVLWVQGQLTDNSWLLYPDVRLTGGFAYVIWFKGEHRGEFVLTLGGYHPDFHRDGYPQVPRLGLRWSIGSNIVVKAGTYFALTSEALMAGGDFEVSASFGPAWAELRFGAHGIVFFDPFHYQVDAYVRIAAGVTIDTWLFGEVTITISRGARIQVLGPDFRGTATFEVGPIELSVRFGGSDQARREPLSAADFVAKYLEAGEGGAARPHALMTSFGALPAKGEDSTPDGSSSRPFVVVVEFGLTFTTTVPATSVTRTLAGTPTTQHPPSRALGVAPMEAPGVLPAISLEWRRSGAAREFPFVATPRAFGAFPVGVWGPPQDANAKKIPKAEMIEALNELDLACRATPSGGGPEIPYYQVEIGKRKPLPFARRTTVANAVKTLAADVAGLVAAPATVGEAFAAGAAFLKATSSRTALAALRGERQAPPLLGTLAERIESAAPTVVPEVGARRPPKRYDHFVDPPVAVGLLAGGTVDLRVAAATRTTVKDSARLWRTAPPTLAAVEAERSRSIAARLVVNDAPAVSTGRAGTVIGATDVPPTGLAHAATAVVARRGNAEATRLADFSAALAPRRGRRASAAAATLLRGQTVVLRLPNARRDTAPDGERPRLAVIGMPARVVVLGAGGTLLADRTVGGKERVEKNATLEVARGAERIVAIGGALLDGVERPDAGLAGWHAGMQLPYAGWRTAIAPGCVVHSTVDALASHRQRLDAGWVGGAELARGETTVTTTFAAAPTVVVVVLDDPAAFGDPVGGRRLLLGLDGAARARDAAGDERPPVLLTMDNRSVLAYDVVPERGRPVVVTIASETGWSLVGVLGSSRLDAAGAIALVSARGLDAATRPFAASSVEPDAGSRLEWLGPVRSPDDRRSARALAAGRGPLLAPPRRPTAKGRATKGGATKGGATKTATRSATKSVRKTTTKSGRKSRPRTGGSR